MQESAVAWYAHQADRQARRGLRVQEPLSPDTVRRLGASALLGRYAPKAELYWETNAYGRSIWMMEAMHRILVVVRAELEAEHTLHATTIAMLARVSKGYVSKALRWLDRFGFITILGSWKGRWGGVVAKLKSMFPPPPKGRRSTGGNIEPDDGPWGSWNRAVARIEGRDEQVQQGGASRAGPTGHH